MKNFSFQLGRYPFLDALLVLLIPMKILDFGLDSGGGGRGATCRNVG